jgi:hypothetical protein
MRLCAAVSGKWTCTGNLPCFGPQRSPLSRPGFWRSKPERRDHRQRRAEATASGGGSKPMAHDRRPAPSRAPPPAPHTPPARPSAPTRWLLGGAPPVAYPAPATCSSRSGHDLNKRMESPLHMAAYKGRVHHHRPRLGQPTVLALRPPQRHAAAPGRARWTHS